MKQAKLLFLLLTVLPLTVFSQTSSSIDDLLNYINTEFGKYNKYDAHFDVEDKKLVFANKFGVARIPFSKIDFKINEETFSVDVYCTNGEKCIYKYDDDGKRTDWDYYNVSMPDGDGMASSAYSVLEKCKQLKNLILNGSNNNNTTVDAKNADDLLIYINNQFRKYNKYGSQFSVNKYSKSLVFKNKFGNATIPFSEIGFRLNEKHQSIDFYCLDGSKCIQKYDDRDELTEWDYYNVSLVTEDGEMASEIYTVLSKCKKLKKIYTSGSTFTDEDVVETNESVNDLLKYINGEFDKYNKYESRFSVDGENLVFMNKFGRATIPFRSISFRMNDKHNSIDVYCTDGSKCILKYDDENQATEWDYYNVSLPDDGGMAASATTVLQKCKALKAKVLN